ncbi:E3 ubiquitin-protein ligase RBBP6-like [Acropora muricata]|uniref:E3 ubiquitin-protein ligase RBBP6-like n=1 Tax=Acropora muricata TaxID=159855 RepID=UPI0034E5B9CF
MSCIHYKFRSALEYDTITFDGLSISLADLKHSIITQKKFGKSTDFDLEVTNAQTKEKYKDDMTMIPKNSSVVVRRIPVGTKSKAQLAAERASPFSSGEQKTSASQDYQVAKSQKLSKITDLASADASEEDKLKAMMKQSGEDWDPSQYVKGRRPYAPGVPVPHNYVCYRCGKPGHFIRNCPTNGDNRFDVPKAKRTTGIPRTFLDTTEGAASPPAGGRSSPSLSTEVDSKTKGKGANVKKVPSELKCPTCSNLLTDAVLIPCCGTSYCDECIRNYLLENDLTCPSCGTENVSPDSLVINKQLRQAVNTFKNARSASPYVPPVLNSTPAVPNSAHSATQPSADSLSSDSPIAEIKPAGNKVLKKIDEANDISQEDLSKPPQAVKPVTAGPQLIRAVHHSDAPTQQGIGFKQDSVGFDPRRRQGDFLPRGQGRPEVRHGLSEPVVPHGLPPERIPRVPAIRPNVSGASHLGPRMSVPGFVPGVHPTHPAVIPRIPAVPTLVRGPVSHHPTAFAAPIFDPLRPTEVPRSLTPPMSEREFYKMQKKLKSRGKKKREHDRPSSTYTSRESRSRKEPKKETRKDIKKTRSAFDFDDELSAYRKLQKSRQRRSVSPSLSRSWSRSPSRSGSRSYSLSRSRSRSPSHSSRSPARSPTPEGWDESRSPSPVSSCEHSAPASAEEKKRRHKKRKKEHRSKDRKKHKLSHDKEGENYYGQEEQSSVDKGEEKRMGKERRDQRNKGKVDGNEIKEGKVKFMDLKDREGKEMNEREKVKEENKPKEKETDREERKSRDKNNLEFREPIKEQVKEKRKGKDGEKKKGSEKEMDKKMKEKKKKKEKSKKQEETSSSAKKRKNKKKHKKHKRHKKEKSKENKGEEDTSDDKVKDSENLGVSSTTETGPNTEGKSSTDDETALESEDDAQHADSTDEQEGNSEEERTTKEKRRVVKRDDENEGSDSNMLNEGELWGNETDEEKLLSKNGNDLCTGRVIKIKTENGDRAKGKEIELV